MIASPPTQLAERDMAISSAQIEAGAEALYMSRYNKLANGNYPPLWRDAKPEIQDWVREGAKAVLIATALSSVGEAR